MGFLDPGSLIEASGYIGIFAVIFTETGLLIGFFLPGDSLLFTAGFLAATDYLRLDILLAVSFSAAVIGDATGYHLGKKYGARIFRREEGKIFHRENVEKAQAFYEAHGGKAIIFGRFLPVIRTAVPVLAGVARMPYRKFLAYNVAGAVLWAVGMTVLGYYFGRVMPDAGHAVIPIVLLITILSVIPSVVGFINKK